MTSDSSLQKREAKYSSIKNINGWWRGRGNCITGSWRKYEEKQRNVTKDNNPLL